MRDNYLDYSPFVSSLKHHECSIYKLDITYHQSDHRCWSALINAGTDNIIVTFSMNKLDIGSRTFDIISETKVIMDVAVPDILYYLDQFLGQGVTAVDLTNIQYEQ